MSAALLRQLQSSLRASRRPPYYRHSSHRPPYRSSHLYHLPQWSLIKLLPRPPPKTASAAQPPPTAHALLGALASGSLTARVFTGSVPTPRLHGRQVSVQAFQPAATFRRDDGLLTCSHEKPISLEAVFAARIADEAVRVSEGLLYPMPPSTARPSTTVPASNTNNAYGVVWPFGQPQQPFDPAASTTAMDEGRAVFRGAACQHAGPCEPAQQGAKGAAEDERRRALRTRAHEAARAAEAALPAASARRRDYEGGQPAKDQGAYTQRVDGVW